jgi:hypothetical protein
MRAIPWAKPIRVQFTCDDKPLFGCRLCILRYGLKTGDRTRLFTDEFEALSHTCSHAEMAARAINGRTLRSAARSGEPQKVVPAEAAPDQPARRPAPNAGTAE